MKKRFCRLATALMLVFCFLPAANVFAVNGYYPEDGENFDWKTYYRTSSERLYNRPTVSLSVNDNSNARIKSGETLTFTASVANDSRVQVSDTMTWSYDLGSGIQSTTTPIVNKTATFILNYDDISAINPNVDYLMTAIYTENGIEARARVKFGILNNNVAVILTEPVDEVVSINDPLHLKYLVYPGANSTSMVTRWTCSNASILSPGYACPSDDAAEANIAYKRVGTYQITVTVTDQDGISGTASVTMRVVEDRPRVFAYTGADEYEPGETVTVRVISSDKYGTINRLDWGCDEGEAVLLDHSYTINPPSATYIQEFTITLPDHETNTYHCKVKAVDDDGEANDPFDLPIIVRAAQVVTPPTDPVIDNNQTETNNNEQTTQPEVNEKNDVTSPNTGVIKGENASAVQSISAAVVAAIVMAICYLKARRLIKK